jgi:hypothetical protein
LSETLGHLSDRHSVLEQHIQHLGSPGIQVGAARPSWRRDKATWEFFAQMFYLGANELGLLRIRLLNLLRFR